MFIFISYGHGMYSDLAKRVRARFEEMNKNGEGNFQVFLDDRIELGSNWEVEIEKALKKTDYFLFFLCEYSSREDSFCRKENMYIQMINEKRKEKKEKEIVAIPIRLDESLPPISLVTSQAVMWMEEDKDAKFDEKFNEILRALKIEVKGEPEPVKTVHTKIWEYITIGDFAQTDRKMDEAIDNYYNAYNIAKREYDENETADTMHDYSATLQRLGYAYELSDKTLKARKFYAELLEVTRENAQKYPSYESNRDLSVILNKMGSIALKEDDVSKAKEYYEEMFKRLRENAQNYPSYVSNRDLSVSLNSMGDIALKEDDVQKAKEYYEKSLEIRRENAQKYPSYESKRGLSVSLERMGDIAEKEDNIKEAKKYYKKSLKINRENARKYPSYESFCNLSKFYAKTALAEKADGNLDKAKELFQNALENAEKCLKIYQCNESLWLCSSVKVQLAILPKTKRRSMFKRKKK